MESKPIRPHHLTGSKQGEFLLFQNLPTMVLDDSIALFNFQKSQMAELHNRSNDMIREAIQYLDGINFFDVKIALTPGEIIDRLEIVLNSTRACNMECCYCFQGAKHGNASVLEKWMAVKFINKLMELCPGKDIHISFFGGEPALNVPLLKEVTEYVSRLRRNLKRSISLSIFTNGIMEKDLLVYLLKNDFYFSVSYDGLSDIQDSQRPLKGNKRSSEIVERNIKYIARNTDKLRVRVTVTRDSVRLMPRIVENLAAFGVKLIHFEPVTIAGKALEPNQGVKMPEADEFVENFIASLEIARKSGVLLLHSCYSKLLFPSIYRCDGMSGHLLAISPSGLISHCPGVQDVDHPLVNLMKLGYLDFESKSVCIPNDLKNQKIIQNSNSQGCKECFARYTCSSGCFSRNYHMTGSPYNVDDLYCATTKSIFKHLLGRIYTETKRRGGHVRETSVTIWDIVIPQEFSLVPNNRPNY